MNISVATLEKSTTDNHLSDLLVKPVATVVITTRNRKDDICKAIESVLRQTIPAEILVMDDDSEDGTASMVSATFPSVRVVRSETRLGLIVQRNKAAGMARGEFIFSLDDDAVYMEPDILERVVALFDNPRVGAVAMPGVNVVDGRRIQMGAKSPQESIFWITNTYIGFAHAVRRDLFLKLGGYEGALFQWGEEENYCQKLYANGYVVRIADCGITEHYPNPVGRHTRAKNVWIYRNSILNIWFYAPLWLVPALWSATGARFLLFGVKKPRELPIVMEGLARGLWWAVTHPSSRNPVGFQNYIMYMRLRAAKVTPFSTVQNRLPELKPLRESPGF
jgi:GT2 family glycosyltransferase